jgi:ATP adenylyltransferase
MKRLWAPWRMKYLNASKTNGCIFCQKVQEDRDRENLILWRGEKGFVLLNLYPYNNGHQLSPETLADLMGMVQKSLAVLRQAMNPHAFNIGINLGAAAGAGITDHMHIHVVPRWTGDTNFMLVLSETRVVPDFLENTYDLLLTALQELDRE